MGRASREEDILGLFYNYPTKHWHFKEIRKNVPIADNKISRWLKVFLDQKLIKKIHNKHKMPYYVSNYTNPDYQNRKRLFALKQMNDTGFLSHILSLRDAKTVIIFGSITRWDWHKNSDIDIFIYGNDDNFEQGKYEKLLGREIQVFNCKNNKGLRRYNNMIKNIVKGDIIKGDINFLEVSANA